MMLKQSVGWAKQRSAFMPSGATAVPPYVGSILWVARLIALILITGVLSSSAAFAASRTYFMYFNTGTTLTQPAVTTNTTCPTSSDTNLNGVSGISLIADADNTICVPANNRDVIWNSATPTFSLYFNGSGYASATNVTGTSVGLSIRTAAATGTVTVKLFYTTTANTKVYFTGTPPTQNATSTRTAYTINLSGLSATNVPAGAKIGVEFSWPSASTGMRLSVNQSGINDKLIVDETAATPTTSLIAEYHLEETKWNGTSGEVKDSSGNNLHGKTVGSPKPSPATTSPAKSGAVGTCGYGSMPGPANGGGAFNISNLPVSTTSGNNTSVSFWMYWNGTDNVQPLGWNAYNLWIYQGSIGFNTGGYDLFGASASGLVNGWHHVVAIFNNGDVNSSQLYVDGVKKILNANTNAPSNSYAVVQSTLMVGGWTANSSFRFPGRIDEIKIFKGALTQSEVTTLYNETHACTVATTTGPNHIRLIHNGSGVTCSASPITVKACADSNCTSLYSGSTTVALSSTNGTWSSNPVTFTGSTSTNLSVTTAQNITIGTSSISPVASNSTRCFAGSTETCSLTFASSGFLFDVPNHRADSSQSISISAVANSGGSCSSNFANTTRSLNFTCSYLDPSSGTLPALVGGTALNSGGSASTACDSNGKAVNLAFNSSGIATTTVQYPDVGQMQLSAKYTGSTATGDSGLVINGSDNFIAAPSSFSFSSITSPPIKASNNFSATVAALNANNAITPNFGKASVPESVTLSHQLIQPTGAGAAIGVFSGTLGSFNNGSASSNDLNWSEVGTIKLNAALTSASYLNSGFNVTGTSSPIGAFIPDHFITSVTQGCNADNFTYSGQPFSTTVTAQNAARETTLNYDGSANTSPNFAKQTTLSEGGTALGTISSSNIALTSFLAGTASVNPTFTFNNVQTTPSTISIRATDANVSSSGYQEGGLLVYSGRLNLENANGSELVDLSMPLQAEYWSGNYYELKNNDNCTSLTIPTSGSGITFGNPLSIGQTSATINGASSGTSLLSSGKANLLLSKPSSGNTGYVDITINAPSWLEFDWKGSGNIDPNARATFGIYKGDPGQIYFREVF